MKSLWIRKKQQQQHKETGTNDVYIMKLSCSIKTAEN